MPNSLADGGVFNHILLGVNVNDSITYATSIQPADHMMDQVLNYLLARNTNCPFDRKYIKSNETQEDYILLYVVSLDLIRSNGM